MFRNKKARMRDRKPEPPVHDDLVQREFIAAVPNELWLSRYPEHWSSEDNLTLCGEDVFSNQIVGAAADNTAITPFCSMLQKKILNRKPWATRDGLRSAIVTWIERAYERCRRQSWWGV